ncbi:Frequency [Pleurostoma richardsiae]|uniref:Frequency n=1 Tax=Pleurostoma richardsiae TaxID=41990 RepID=A0AA38RU21_9PEZI|nr:Frequency [Pleurostoma richardsiae]
MGDAQSRPHSTQPPPTEMEDLGHCLPRRASPENSVTLHHHRLSRDASVRASPGSRAAAAEGSPPRRQSSGESHQTGQSDARKWFDRSNRNAAVNYDSTSMDVDPPFFQNETDSSNEERHVPPPASMLPYPPPGSLGPSSQIRPTLSRSSSAADFRSVIDDLTIENKRLKEELKRYKQFGRDLMNEDKLFEIKMHGLPRRKKRELEETLRDFAAGIGDASAGSSPRKPSPKHTKRLHGSSLSNSKHASSSSSKSRPTDSAYASMSTGASSGAPNSSNSVSRPFSGRSKSSNQKVQSYLKDIPEGLYPRHMLMTEKERKKWVVRRLEQLFTGKLGGKPAQQNQQTPALDPSAAPATAGTVFIPPSLPVVGSSGEASREAVMQSTDSGKKSRSRDNRSASNSNGENTELGGKAGGSGGGSGSRSSNDTSPPTVPLADQRPTRPRDLDPDRAQMPSENMDYIRHLGVIPPEYLSESTFKPRDVGVDAEGWVYLNLLSNLAQLHIANVTQDFIRSAVSEKSAKFQLSPDGQKIRWRGGIDGTKFSSDSSGELSKGSSTDDTEGSNEEGQRKKRKTEGSTQASSKDQPNLRTQTTSGSSAESFHYKPLFIHRQSSAEESTEEESASQGSYGGGGDSNRMPNSHTGSGSSQRKRRRNDGAIVYYSGAPFCIDLSGDAGDLSPTTYMMTSTSQPQESDPTEGDKPQFGRTLSGSSLPFRPLSDGSTPLHQDSDDVSDRQPEPELITDGTDSDGVEGDFPWCDEPATPKFEEFEPCLEACGLGGVIPEDHFRVACLTRRPRNVRTSEGRPQLGRTVSEETADSIISRLATLSAASPTATTQLREESPPVEIEYLRITPQKLEPASLPAPAMFYPPFSSSSESETGFDFLESDEESEEDDEEMAESSAEIEAVSQKANPHQSDNTFAEEEELSANDEGDEEDEDPLNSREEGNTRNSSSVRPPHSHSRRIPLDARRSGSGSVGRRARSGELLHTGSSVATAGGEESGYSSSEEMDDD